jgi:hypothetical protein
MRVEDKTFLRDFEIFDFVMLFGVKDMFAVGRQPFSQMDVIGIAAEAGPVVGYDPDRAFFYFFQDASIG